MVGFGGRRALPRVVNSVSDHDPTIGTERRDGGRLKSVGNWPVRCFQVLVSLALAGACSAAAVGGIASTQPSQVVVSADRSGSFANLFLLTSGGALRRLTSKKAEQTDPALSPSGTELAYVQAASATCVSCPSTIWIVNTDGSHIRGLTYPQPYNSNPTLWDESPSWSPDGKQIVFSRESDFSYELFTIPNTGGTPRDLFVGGVSPAWGPTRIAYIVLPFERPGPVSLWTIKPNGSDATEVTSGFIESPAWSRDGDLAYLNQPPGGKPILVVMAGGAMRQYSLPLAQATSVSWSPDNKHLAVVAQARPQGKFDVYSIGADGSGLRRLTTNADALSATWGI